MRRLFFLIADLVANAAGGALVGLTVWRLVVPETSMFLGMLLGMVVGMALALIGSLLLMPILGGHEVMIPLMLTGMVAGMVVGMAVPMRGLEVAAAPGLGAVVGLVVSIVCTGWTLALSRPFVPPPWEGETPVERR